MAWDSSSDSRELELIKESIVRPSAEDEAKRSLLARIYSQVAEARRGRDRALNGGLLASVPPCVYRGEPCPDDSGFTYNAIRVLMSRYMVRDEAGRFLETPSMVMRRVAEGFRSRVDPERLYRLLVDRRFVFNSPTLFNMYSDGARGTLSACYVTPIYDDMRAIMDAGVVQAMTFKWGGGQGFSFSELRPRWDVVRGTSGYSSGPLSFIHLYDTITELVKQGGKRRGANMGIMHAWHPDLYNPDFDPSVALRNSLPVQVQGLIDAFKRLISELEEEGYTVDEEVRRLVESLSKRGWWTKEDAGFIQAKKPPLQDANITNFNISVGVNDAFMKAVIEDSDWWMVNPRYSDRGDGIYRIHYSVSTATGMGMIGVLAREHPWLLDNPYLNIFEEEVKASLERAMESLSSRGLDPLTKNPYAWRIRARILWDEIVESAWGGGDPGLVYFDNHNKWNPTPWLGVVVATNPCSEQPLYPFENCNLGSVSIEKYVEEGRFKLEEFYRDVLFVTQALDAAIDLNNHPDERHYRVNNFTRKIGLGIMGLADALARLGLPYDSEEAVAFTMIVMAGLEAYSWLKSWELGATLGHAPAFECRRYDWRRLECVEPGSPEELAEMHTPALVKAGMVVRINDGWVEVKYHDIEITDSIIEGLVGESRNRLGRDGSLRLVRLEALLRVAREVFGIDPGLADAAASSDPGEVARDPRALLALAVFRPLDAWRVIVSYGRSMGARAPRNTVTTTIAPTGTISIIAGTSSGIEPYFALVYLRQVAVGSFLEVVREFRRDLLGLAEEYGVGVDVVRSIYDEIMKSKGSLRWALGRIMEILDEKGVPEGFKEGVARLSRKYATSMDFDLWYHLAHQVAAQIYADQAISKTVNLPSDATQGHVNTAYLLAWLGGLKGFTIYRDESKGVQVIVFGGEGGGDQGRILRKRPRRAARMQIVKRKASGGGSGASDRDTVVVGLADNSTCKTCDL